MASFEVKYLLELEEGGLTTASFALLHVSHVTREHVPATHRERTLGKRPATEHAGVRDQVFVLRGRTGTDHVLGNDRKGAKLYAEGPEIHRQFIGFLHRYLTKARDAERLGRHDVRLIYRALWEKQDWYVEILNEKDVRDVNGSRFGYQWEIRLVTDEPALQAPRGFLGQVRDIAEKISDTIDQATSYVAQANAFVDEVQLTLNSFKEPVAALGRMMDEIANLAGGVGGLVAFPYDLADEGYRTAERSAAAVFALYEALPLADKSAGRDVFLSAMRAIGRVRRSTLELLGLARRPVSRGERDPGQVLSIPGSTEIVVNRPVVLHTLKANETLRDIAQQYLGSRDAWRSIASMNGMSSPNKLSTGAPLTPGALLTVPAPSSGGLPQGAGINDLFGTDWRLTSDGDLAMSGTTDIATVSGDANLIQALTERCSLQQGDNAVFPSNGVPVQIGQYTDPTEVGELAAQLRSQLKSDSRIDEVTNIEVIDGGDRLDVTFTVEPVTGSPIDVTLPLS